MSPENKTFLEEVGEIVRILVISLMIVVPIRLFVAQPFIVRGASMEPTFYEGEYLVVDELSYRFRDPERGEVIILRYPRNPNEFFIKRVIGLPGETVAIESGKVYIETNGERRELDEPYISDVLFLLQI